MRWSITVGSVAGTAVRIHVTFLLLIAWIFGANTSQEARRFPPPWSVEDIGAACVVKDSAGIPTS